MKAHTTFSLLIFTAILCFISELSHGQEIKVIRRNIEVPQEDVDDQQSSDYNQFAVTVDPIRIISGEFPLRIMYAPVDWLALEAGSGLTTENFVIDLFEDGSFTNDEEFISQKNKINISDMFQFKALSGGICV
ncbi:MAG: hypothetical protein U5L96_19510 [Owenweeksia sp.]|nr:hypothetical protein [Owenweeksia sp.]